MSVRVKICGVTTPEDACAAVARGADYLGLNFHPASPRCVSLEQARTISNEVETASLVGVFVDAPEQWVTDVAEQVGLDLVQLHGSESPAYCGRRDQPVIKAIRARKREQVELEAERYAQQVAYLLVDAWVPGQAGGTGQRIDPAVVAGLDAARVFVAGGLTPENVAEVVRTLRPFAVDVASGVERHPGLKDHDAVERFVHHAKSA